MRSTSERIAWQAGFLIGDDDDPVCPLLLTAIEVGRDGDECAARRHAGRASDVSPYAKE